jgi:N6-adenosine-specific RNA methylase IME4
MSEQTASVVDLGLARLVHIEQRIGAAEGDGLRARWEFGRELLAKREGKQLPRGLLAKVCEETGASRWEIQTRMRFAERYPTEQEVSDAITHFGSWYGVVHHALAATADDQEDGTTPLAPPGTFATLVADPPWQYANRATRGAAEDHYPTMTVEDLCALDVPHDKAAPDAHLYLWTTAGFLRDAFEVMDAWGFTYKTFLAWVKPQMGMGNYFRVSSELVLFGVKGHLPTQRRDLMNWFEARRSRHSAKPDAFPELVTKASPGPYLELFARCDRERKLICYCTRCRFGWEVWGREA